MTETKTDSKTDSKTETSDDLDLLFEEKPTEDLDLEIEEETTLIEVTSASDKTDSLATGTSEISMKSLKINDGSNASDDMSGFYMKRHELPASSVCR